MSAHAAQGGPVGPDSLNIPGAPQRLNHAAGALRELAERLNTASKNLRAGGAPAQTLGRTVRALSNIGGRAGLVLEADVQQLTELAEAIERESQLLEEAQGLVQQLKQRWRSARETVRQELDTQRNAAQAEADGDGKGKGEGQGQGRRRAVDTVEPHEIIRSVDHEVVDNYDGPLDRLAGIKFSDRNGHGSVLLDEESQQVMRQYRQEVTGVFEELIEAIRRVNRADEHLAELLPRAEKSFVTGANEASESGDPQEISRPMDLETVGEEIQNAAQELNQVSESLRDIRLGIREGRMTPDDERVGSMEGFERTWSNHLDELREDLNHAKRSSTSIADELRKLDERGAREVRRSGRENA